MNIPLPDGAVALAARVTRQQRLAPTPLTRRLLAKRAKRHVKIHHHFTEFADEDPAFPMGVKVCRLMTPTPTVLGGGDYLVHLCPPVHLCQLLGSLAKMGALVLVHNIPSKLRGSNYNKKR